VHKSFAGDQILEIQAGLLYERSVLGLVVEFEPLFAYDLLLGLVLRMPSPSIDL
jgi:hypothetical protein